jgi:site-specific recombinase XerC
VKYPETSIAIHADMAQAGDRQHYPRRIIAATLARGAKVQGNRSLAYVRAFFNWLVDCGRLPASPVAGMKLPTKEQPRDRVLSDDELRWSTGRLARWSS